MIFCMNLSKYRYRIWDKIDEVILDYKIKTTKEERQQVKRAVIYIKSRYGSVYNTPLFRGGPYVGYANGTDNATPGLHLVGERGPEILAFNGGEKVLDNNKTQQIFSQSKPYGGGNKSNYINVGSPTFQVIVSGGNDPKATATEVDKVLRRKFSKYFDKEMEKIAIQMGYVTIGEL